MAIANAINAQTAGVQGMTAAGVWTGSSVTNHAVIVGGSTVNTLTSVGPTATAGQVLQSAGSSADPAFSTATYPSTATGTGTILRADGTNWAATTSTYPNTNAVNTLLYASSANVMGALATANSGVLTTDSSGVPSIDTTNFVRQTTGMQVKGNNTNTAPPAGFIGEYISSAVTGVATTTNIAKTITSISLTAGVWNVTAMANSQPTGGTLVMQQQVVGISTTNNTIEGNFGDQKTIINQAALGSASGCVADFRVLLSATTTYYLVVTNTYSSTTCPTAGRISGTRVG